MVRSDELYHFQKKIRAVFVQKFRKNLKKLRENVVAGVGGMAEPLNIETGPRKPCRAPPHRSLHLATVP